MHTPSSYMYSDLRSFGGITNKEAASELLTGRTLCGNGAPRDRINERTFLSRQIVHAAPSQVHPEFFGDFHQSAQTITSKIVSNLAKPCAYHEVIEHYGGVAAKEMGLFSGTIPLMEICMPTLFAESTHHLCRKHPIRPCFW